MCAHRRGGQMVAARAELRAEEADVSAAVRSTVAAWGF